MTYNSIEKFTFIPGYDLRCTLDGMGAPWFVVKDICDLLGIGSQHALSKLHSTEHRTVKASECAGLPNRGAILTSESGLYALVMRSRKPEAEQFRRWVTSEVLPSIRKDGGYVTKATAEAMAEDPEVMLSKALLFASRRLEEEVVKNTTLVAQNVVLEKRGFGLEEHEVQDTSVHDWLRANKVPITRGQRIQLGVTARMMSKLAGRPAIKKPSPYVNSLGENRIGTVYLHTKKSLDRAAVAVGLRPYKEEEYA